MAIAACMAYVDLNPIRAGIAETPETSDFTSVKDRIEDRESAAEVSTADAQDHRIEHGEKAGWLAPIPLEAKRKKVREKETDRRAGNKGCLPMSLDDYLQLLDWTGRQFRTEKRGAIPAACAPILDRLDFSEETWFDLVKNFRKRFRNEAGSLPSVRAFRSKRRARRAIWQSGLHSVYETQQNHVPRGSETCPEYGRRLVRSACAVSTSAVSFSCVRPPKGVVKRVVDTFHAALLRLSRFPQTVERQVLTERIEESGRHDLNVRLPAPKAGALAKLSYAPDVRRWLNCITN